jgi:hypothetical protein
MSKNDAAFKVATNVSVSTKAQLTKLAIRERITLSEYVRRVLFNHVQEKLDMEKPSTAPPPPTKL